MMADFTVSRSDFEEELTEETKAAKIADEEKKVIEEIATRRRAITKNAFKVKDRVEREKSRLFDLIFDWITSQGQVHEALFTQINLLARLLDIMVKHFNDARSIDARIADLTGMNEVQEMVEVVESMLRVIEVAICEFEPETDIGEAAVQGPTASERSETEASQHDEGEEGQGGLGCFDQAIEPIEFDIDEEFLQDPRGSHKDLPAVGLFGV